MVNNLIYKIYLIDGDNGISLLECSFRNLNKIQDFAITGFFNAVNRTVDNIQEAMAKGRRVNEMSRVLESEDSTIAIYYHPISRVLFCSISDADDNTDKIKALLQTIGRRFWKKHQSDLKLFRTTTEKNRFKAFTFDLENLSMAGKIAEVFPTSLIKTRSVLEKILSMGMIDDFEFQVALTCNGKNSPLKISRIYEKTVSEIYEILKKLEELDIIKI